MIRNSRFAHLAGPYVRQFGFNPDIDTGTDPEDVWPAGGLYAFPTAAAITTILSSDANDDGSPAGTGARTVEVVGLATLGGPEITETVVMNGTSTVELVIDLIRVLHSRVLTVGSGGVNAGIIDVRHSATNLCRIPIGAGESQQAIYTVPGLPTGKRPSLTPYLTSVQVAAITGTLAVDRALVELFTRVFGAESWRSRGTFGVVVGQDHQHDFEMAPISLAPGDDIRLQVTNVTADNMGVAGEFIINWIP